MGNQVSIKDKKRDVLDMNSCIICLSKNKTQNYICDESNCKNIKMCYNCAININNKCPICRKSNKFNIFKGHPNEFALNIINEINPNNHVILINWEDKKNIKLMCEITRIEYNENIKLMFNIIYDCPIFEFYNYDQCFASLITKKYYNFVDISCGYIFIENQYKDYIFTYFDKKKSIDIEKFIKNYKNIIIREFNNDMYMDQDNIKIINNEIKLATKFLLNNKLDKYEHPNIIDLYDMFTYFERDLFNQ